MPSYFLMQKYSICNYIKFMMTTAKKCDNQIVWYQKKCLQQSTYLPSFNSLPFSDQKLQGVNKWSPM